MARVYVIGSAASKCAVADRLESEQLTLHVSENSSGTRHLDKVRALEFSLTGIDESPGKHSKRAVRVVLLPCTVVTKHACRGCVCPKIAHLTGSPATFCSPPLSRCE